MIIVNRNLPRCKIEKSDNCCSPVSHVSPIYPSSQPKIHVPLLISHALSGPAQCGLQLCEQLSPYVLFAQPAREYVQYLKLEFCVCVKLINIKRKNCKYDVRLLKSEMKSERKKKLMHKLKSQGLDYCTDFLFANCIFRLCFYILMILFRAFLECGIRKKYKATSCNSPLHIHCFTRFKTMRYN